MRAPSPLSPITFALVALALLASPASAEPLIYEGHLAGLPANAAQVDLRFTLYADPEADDPVWISDDLRLPVDDGRFVAELQEGPDGPLEPYHFAGSRWLEVSVLPPGEAAVPLSPRQRIGWTPTAFDPTVKSRAADGVFLISVHCGGGAHAAGAMARFDDLGAAVGWLDDKRIAEGTTVRIAVRSDCTLDETLRVAHPDGRRIEIVGDPDGLEPPILSFSDDGVIVGAGDRLGLLSGFRIRREPSAAEGPTSWGIKAEQGGMIMADDLTVQGFFYGIVAENGGLIVDPTDNSGPLVAIENGTGFGAYWGGVIRAYRAEARDNTRDGMSASGNGTLVSSYAVATGNDSTGFSAAHAGVMRIVHSVSEANGVDGFAATLNAHMYADYSLSRGNGNDGYSAGSSATIDASISVSEDNDIGYYANINGALLAGSSFSILNARSALWASYQGHISFPCRDWEPRHEELNPRGLPVGPPIQMPEDPAEDAVAIRSITEGVIRAPGCPAGGQALPAEGRQLDGASGHLEHPAAGPACCEAP